MKDDDPVFRFIDYACTVIVVSVLFWICFLGG
jgi:hypothetical protein